MGGSINERAARLPGLDAIRVVAVVAVLLYHADEIVPGGLLGVTVFFVLSGFLITGQVWNGIERNAGRLDAKDFWSRRVRRLLPASLLVVAVVSVTWPALGYDLPLRDLVSAVLPIRNWAMLRSDAGYGASPSPTAHFWSLAVEEQVYLVLPFLLLVLARLRSRRMAGGALAVLAAVAVAAGAALAAAGHLDRAYLSTYTRAGEVLAGASAALLWRTGPRPRRAGVLAIAGAAALGAVFGLLSWPSANVSTIGIPVTVVATLALCGSSMTTGTWWAGVGRTRVVRVTADHAYELYLVHVPLYAVVNQYRTGLSGSTLILARLVLTAVVAAGLHVLVEPIRRRRFAAQPITFATTVMVLAATALVLPVVTSADRSRLSTMAVASELPELSPPVLAATVTVPRAAVGRSVDAPHSPDAPTTTDAPTTSAAAIVPEHSVWYVGDSTIRELDDAERTTPRLTDALSAAGWRVTDGVGVRALMACSETDWGEHGEEQELVHLPAVQDVVAAWWAASPADHVLIQLGANDLARSEWDPAAFGACIDRIVESVPPDVEVAWVAPVVAEWCWCSAEIRGHVPDFVELLRQAELDHPNLTVFVDAMSLLSADDLPRQMAEDGVHATATGRSTRVAALVEQMNALG